MNKIFKITESQFKFIQQYIKNQILIKNQNNHINESLGINDEVTRATQELYTNAAKHTDELLSGKNVSFKLNINDFDNIDVYLFPSTNADGNSYYKSNRKMSFINIHVKISNGKIDWNSFMDTAQHEIHHIFEQDMVRKTCYNQASLEAKAIIRDNNVNNRVLAIIAYVSDPFEQKAMINGMYAFIRQCKKENKLPVNVSEIDAYQQLAKLYAAKNYLETHQHDDDLLKYMHPNDRIGFGWSRKKFRNRAIKGIKSLEYRIRRVIQKCKEDGLSENGMVVIGEDDWKACIDNNASEL